MKNEANPITSLTIEQIQGIYTGKITNWNVVGGNNATIVPYVRNQNSGSQELMNQLVLAGLPTYSFPEELIVIPSMGMVYSLLSGTPNGISYTVYYYDDNKMWMPEKIHYFTAFKYTDGRETEIVKGGLKWNGEIEDL